MAAKTLSGSWALAINGGMKAVSFVNADGTTGKSLITGAAAGSQVFGGQIWSNESAANTWIFSFCPAAGTTTGTTQYQINTFLMTSTNADGVAFGVIIPSNMPGAMVDNAGNRYFQLDTNDQIFVAPKTAVPTTAGKISVITLNYRDFS